MTFDIMSLFGPSATNRLLQPIQSPAGVQNFLTNPQASIQPQADPWEGLRQPTVDPMQTAGTAPQTAPAAAPAGSKGIFSNFGKRGLQDMFLGWAMGQTPMQSLSLGAANMAKGSGDRRNRNETVEWLKGRGIDEGTARQMAGDQKTLQAYLVDSFKPKDPQSLVNAGSGRIYDPNSGEWIVAPDAGSGFREATPEEAAKYGSVGGQFGPDGRFYPINPPSGTSLQVDPETGAVSFQQGSGVKPLTEGQSKDTVYATRAQGSLPLIDQHGDALTSLGQSVAGSVPVVGNYAKTPEFQQAEQAGKEFLQAILRKDTGAAITKEETSEYGSVYLPQPGDSAEVLAQKKQSRQRALEALKAGMPPQAILQQERALANTGDRSAPISQQQYDSLPSGAEFVAPDGTRRRKP